jgi:hypothetical protein
MDYADISPPSRERTNDPLSANFALPPSLLTPLVPVFTPDLRLKTAIMGVSSTICRRAWLDAGFSTGGTLLRTSPLQSSQKLAKKVAKNTAIE